MADSNSDDERDPLNHLMNSDESIVPTQIPSVRPGEMLQLSFVGETTVIVNLVLDAHPGCGGVAWPAGEVGWAPLCSHSSFYGPRF
jgi:hypothetical protein